MIQFDSTKRFNQSYLLDTPMHSISTSSWIQRFPTIGFIFYGWSLFVLLNCYLTPNPYSAIHSGRASINAEYFSVAWRISPAWFVIIVSMIVVIITSKQAPLDKCVPFSIILMFISGLYTNDISTNLKTYIFDSVMLILCAFAAYRDAMNAPFRIGNLRSLNGFLC